MAEAEQETLEDAMTTNQDRHYMNAAAECTVSSQTLQAFLDNIELDTNTDNGDNSRTAVELLPSAGIHRLGLGNPEWAMLAC